MRATVAVAAVAALVTGAVVTRPAPTGTPLLGRLDLAGGSTATAPPPDGLRVAWAHDVGDEVVGDHWYGPVGPPVVRGDRVLVDGRVVELATGVPVADLRSEPLWGAIGEQGVAAMLRGGRIVTADSVTGDVLHTAEVAGGVLEGIGLEGVAAARADGVSLFSSWPTDASGPGGWLLLADDGTEVARGVGYPQSWSSLRAPGSPYVLVTELVPVSESDGDGLHDGGMLEGSTLVLEAATGREALRLAEPEYHAAVDVAGSTAMTVSWTGGTEGPVGAVARVWDCAFVDLDGGRTLSTHELVSTDRPVLLGVAPDGAAVVGTRAADRVEVLLVDGEAEPAVLTSVGIDLGRGREQAEPTIAAATAGVTGDVVVTLDSTTGRVVATGFDGVRRWAKDVGPEVEGLSVGDGHVAVTSRIDGTGSREVRVLRVEDGAAVVRTSSSTPLGWGAQGAVPLAVIDGVLAVSGVPMRPPHDPAPLQHVDWFRLRDGREQPLDEVVRGWDRAGLLGTGAVPGAGDTEGGSPGPTPSGPDDGELDTGALLGQHLLGVVAGDDGRARPVVGRVTQGGGMDLLDHRGRLVPAAVTDTGASYSWLVGATANRVVLGRERGGGRAEVVVADRRDGRIVATLEGMYGIQVVGDVVLVMQVADGRPDDGMVAVDLMSGEPRWSAGEPFQTWPLRADDRELLEVGAGVVGLRRIDDGALVWERDLGVLLGAHSVLTPGLVVVQTHAGEVVALDRDDGAEVWRTSAASLVTSMAAAGDHVLLGTWSGLVVHLDAAGQERQRVAVGTSAVTAVAPLGDTVVAVVGQRVLALRTDGDGITTRDEVDLPG